jgi:hypothetical protein
VANPSARVVGIAAAVALLGALAWATKVRWERRHAATELEREVSRMVGPLSPQQRAVLSGDAGR